MIYHIAAKRDWDLHKDEVEFVPVDYHKEGFVHCCTEAQLTGVMDRYFKGVKNLVLILLEESKLKAELKYETSTNDEKFPHLYGPINKEAIIKVEFLA